VTPVNDAPVVDPLPPVVTALGRLPGLVRVRVRDVDHDPAALQVTAKSSLAALVPASGITVLPGGSPDERFLRLLPTPGVAAETTITVQASDGVLAGSASFLFRVSPAVSPAMVPLPLVESGAAWRYWVDALPLDSRGNPVDWTRLEVADREWPSGPGPLGYGGQGEKTGVPSLPLRVTTYFRRSFLVADTSQLAGLRLRLRRDDGAVVYLNGVRVLASNMPRGVITATTPASSDLSGAAGLAWVEADLDPTALVSGRNLLAVEVHQSALPPCWPGATWPSTWSWTGCPPPPAPRTCWCRNARAGPIGTARSIPANFGRTAAIRRPTGRRAWRGWALAWRIWAPRWAPGWPGRGRPRCCCGTCSRCPTPGCTRRFISCCSATTGWRCSSTGPGSWTTTCRPGPARATG
ncbi:MAG: hypothetical protein ACKOET_15955, partial [Verrucomicrobiota bacterium]